MKLCNEIKICSYEKCVFQVSGEVVMDINELRDEVRRRINSRCA